jgi:hypothetical protein
MELANSTQKFSVCVKSQDGISVSYIITQQKAETVKSTTGWCVQMTSRNRFFTAYVFTLQEVTIAQQGNVDECQSFDMPANYTITDLMQNLLS